MPGSPDVNRNSTANTGSGRFLRLSPHWGRGFADRSRGTDHMLSAGLYGSAHHAVTGLVVARATDGAAFGMIARRRARRRVDRPWKPDQFAHHGLRSGPSFGSASRICHHKGPGAECSTNPTRVARPPLCARCPGSHAARANAHQLSSCSCGPRRFMDRPPTKTPPNAGTRSSPARRERSFSPTPFWRPSSRGGRGDRPGHCHGGRAQCALARNPRLEGDRF